MAPLDDLSSSAIAMQSELVILCLYLLNANTQYQVNIIHQGTILLCLQPSHHMFLNLPIWANFVDPTEMSLYLYLDQTSSIGWTQPHPQPQTGLAKQHWLRLRPSLLDWAG